MAAARAFARRATPASRSSVVIFNARRRSLLPLTTDRKKIDRGPREAAEARRGDAHLRRAGRRGRQVARLGARRGTIVLLSDGDDVGSVTSLDAAIAQLDAQKVRVFTVGIESPTSRRTTSEDRGRAPAARTPRLVAGGAHEDLRRSSASSSATSTAPLSLRAQPDQNVDGRRQGRRAASPSRSSYTSPPTGTAGAVQAGVQATSSSSPGADAARRGPHPRAGRLHDPLALEPPLEPARSSRGWASS